MNVVFIILLWSINVQSSPSVNDIRNGRTLIFNEEFDTLDRNRWQHLITAWRGGNNEFEYYSNRTENSYTRNGILYIKPTLTADRFGENFLYNGTLNLWSEGCNINYTGGCIAHAGEDIINPIQSARIRTIQSFSFTYGYVEVRAKMPRGDWIWPAIWLMPTENYYGSWPRSGEIDLVEIRSNNNFTCRGVDYGNKVMGSTLHFGTDSTHNIWNLTHFSVRLTDSDFAADFHVYGLQWLPNSITFYVDGLEIGSVKPPPGGFWQLGKLDKNPGGSNIWANGSFLAPFDRKFHFILNVAVGGNFFSDSCVNSPYPKPWSSLDKRPMDSFWRKRDQWLPTWNRKTDDSAMQIDYIRVYNISTVSSGHIY